MAKPHTARAIILSDKDILLVERHRDGIHYFSFPGGGVEPGETLEQAVLRELREETGVHVAISHEVITWEAPDKVHHLFLCEYVSGEPHLAEDSEEAQDMADHEGVSYEPKWISASQIATLPLLYWEPLRFTLLEMLAKGFPESPKVLANE